MKRTLVAFALVYSILLGSGCSPSPNEAANKLYVEASLLLDKAKMETSDQGLLVLYSEANEKIERILADYQSSDVAVNLLSGQTTVSGFTHKQLQEMEPTLQLLASAEANLIEYAFIIAQAIDDPQDRAWAYAIIAPKYLSIDGGRAKELLIQARDAASSIEDRAGRVRVFAYIASQFHSAELDADALETLKQVSDTVAEIADNAERARSLVALAQKYKEIQEQDEAARILKDALALVTDGESYTDQYALGEIVDGFVNIGNMNDASAVIISIVDEWTKNRALTSIVAGYAKAGLYEDADRYSSMLSTPNYRGDALAIIAAEYARDGQILDAIRLTSEIDDISARVDAMTSISAILIEREENQRAYTLLGEAEQLIDNQLVSDEKAKALLEIASNFVTLGQADRAIDLLTRAKVTVDMDDSSVLPQLRLMGISGVFAELGETERALETAEAIQETWIRNSALEVIVAELAKQGRFLGALNIVAELDDPLDTASALAGLAGQYAESNVNPSDKERSIMREISLAAAGVVSFRQ